MIYVFSIFYSDNLVGVGDLLMTKFSLLLFPLLALFMKQGQKLVLLGLKWGLIIGAGISMSFSLVRFAIEYLTEGNMLMASDFAVNMHTSYLALIFIVASILFFFETSIPKKLKWMRIVYLLLALVSVVFLRSMGAVVCLAMLSIALPLWYAFKRKKKRWLLIFPTYGLLLTAMIWISPQLSNDVTTTTSRIKSWQQSPEQFLEENQNSPESNTVRLVVWTLASQAIITHPFGAGIGDKWDLLKFHYNGSGFNYYVKKKLNVHNQFLESGVAIGIPGILLLLFAFVQALRLSWRKNKAGYFLIFLCILVSLLFESMLERSVGVILLGIMTMALIQSVKEEETQ
jgi:hypothetical protein